VIIKDIVITFEIEPLHGDELLGAVAFNALSE